MTNYPDLYASEVTDFHEVNAKARAEQPVFYSDTHQAWVITRYHDVRQVLMHPRLFGSSNAIRPMARLRPESEEELKRGYPLPTTALVNTDGVEHRRLRRPFAKYFELRRIRNLEPFISETVGELVETMQSAGSAEFMREFAEPLALRVTCRLFGLAPGDQEIVEESSASSSLFRRSNVDAEEQLGYAKRVVRFHHLLRDLIEKRRAQPEDDLISFVVTELVPGDAPLSYEATRELIWSLAGMFGGQGTVASALGMTLYYLLSNRDQWENLVARPELAGLAVEELCRYDGPGQTFWRITTQPVTVGDVELPAGANVMVVLGSANRDEALVDRPDEFDITRPRTRHVGFGLSSHNCVGAALARAQMRIALSTLARRLPGLHLTAGHPVSIDGVMNNRKPVELHVSW
jgi:cytochrome P450